MTPHHNVAKPYHFTLPIEGKSTQKETNIGGDKARHLARCDLKVTIHIALMAALILLEFSIQLLRFSGARAY